MGAATPETARDSSMADLVEHASEGLFVADVARRFTYVNAAVCRMLGYSREELLGRPLVELLPAAEEAARLSQPSGHPSEGGIQLAKWTLERKDGTSIRVEASAAILSDGRLQGSVRDITELEHLTAQLRAAEDRYRSLCAAMPDLLFRFDKELRFVEVLAADPSLLALPPASFIGQKLTDVFGEQLRPGEFGFADPSSLVARATEATVRARETGALQRLEYRFREHWYEARVVPCGDDEILAIARDITDLKNAELEVQQSRARFAWLVNESPAIIYVLAATPPHPTTFISANVARRLGYSPEDFTGEPGFRLANVHPEDAAKVLVGQHLLFDEGHHTQELRFRTAKGNYRWIRDEARLVTDPAGHSTEILGSWTDITDRRRLEEALRVSEERLSLAVEASGLGVWDWDIVTDETYLSPRCWQLVGYAENELRPDLAVYYSLIHPDDLPMIETSLQEHLQGRSSQSVVDYRAKKKSGEYRWLHAAGRVTARDVEGAPLRMTGVVMDITEQRNRAEALRREEALRAAVRARDNLLAVVSHDLRGPLSTIQLCVQHLMRKPSGVERRAGRKQLDLVLHATERMNRLIDDLVQAAAIEAGMFTIDARLQDVASIIDDALEALEGQAASRSVRIERRVPRDIPPIWADAQRVVQVLSNLIGNALKFVSVGGRIHVRAWAGAGDVCFSVSDDGPGIPTEQMPHLFDRYWKGKTNGARGVGLGLFIAKGIVERHRGRIWVESRVGVGTTFHFTIPTDRP